MSGDDISFTPITPSVTDGVIEETLFFPAQQHSQVIELVGHLSRYSNLLLTITGQEGSGKSLVKRRILEAMDSGVQVCDLAANRVAAAQGLMSELSHHLGLGLGKQTDLNQYLQKLKQHLVQLHRDGQTCLVVIDDAEQLSSETLELLIILLSDDDENKRPHILLLGAEELIEKLRASRLRERFTAIGHHLKLEPLNTEEAWGYLEYRLSAVSLLGQISETTKADIIRASGGVPGQINRMANLALTDPEGLKKVAKITSLGANPTPKAATQAKKAPKAAVAAPAQEKPARKSSPIPIWHITALAVVASLLIGAFLYQDDFLSSSDTNKVAEDTPLTDLNRLAHPAEETIADSTVLSEDNTASQEESVTIIKPVFPQTETENTDKRAADEALLSSLPPQAEPVTVAPTPAPTIAEKPKVEAKPQPVVQKPVAPTTISSPYKQEEALLKLKGSQYTLQLLGIHLEESAIKFIEGLSDKTGVRYFETIYKDKAWFVVIQGEYLNRDAAIANISKLPKDIQDRKPWARSIASVQADIKKK